MNTESELLAPVTAIKGIGEKLALVLEKLEIRTVGDLVLHYPRRYEDRTQLKKVKELTDGETTTIAGKVTAVENKPTRNKMVITKVSLDDGAKGVLSLTWFGQWRTKQVFEKLLGKRLLVYGTVKKAYLGVEMVAPEWEEIEEDSNGEGSLAMGRIVPIYPLTEGVSQNRMRAFVHAAMTQYTPFVPETLPVSLRVERGLLEIGDAVQNIHFPESAEMLETARRRLVYDELLVMQLLLAGRRQSVQAQTGIAFADTQTPRENFVSALPFTLTGAQERVVAQIAKDMSVNIPMNRLVQGDVGSGKTAVAMAAMAICVHNGYQAALMAPTEILAEQHARSLRPTLEKLGMTVELLTGSLKAKQKASVKDLISGGLANVVVGTHALIQDTVTFANLGLAIIDEQHRFGVLQRAALSAKATRPPDVLVMTATPIPRTLTLTVYGDLDVSIIDELPPGRKPIRTHWKKRTEKTGVYEGIRKLLKEGRQAYVICSLVEESELLEARAATDLHAQLTANVFPEYGVGLLHGRMNPEEKDKAMTDFRANITQVLVATTVVEVGVDVPNAVAIAIEDADRFGLAQLHQLRGRVGRGEHASFCLLIADPKTPDGEERLLVMTQTNDGFRIAEEDLRLRGPGEFYGTRQSGLPALKIADVLRDGDILAEAREDAFALLDADPKLSQPTHRALRDAVIIRRRSLEIATVA
jgi:ATP-dependent DNA helicase RecG